MTRINAEKRSVLQTTGLNGIFELRLKLKNSKQKSVIWNPVIEVVPVVFVVGCHLTVSEFIVEIIQIQPLNYH